MNSGVVVDLGKMEYRKAWDLQRRIGQALFQNQIPDVLLLVEHPPVYTLGKGAHGSYQNLVWDEAKRAQEGIAFVEVDRGGDITYHGPGQLVGYPILNLTRYGRDLHQYLRNLEEALIRALGDFGITAGRYPPNTGVWVGDEKIAAIGVKASRWITQHGFALNVAPNLEHFSGIIPCGIQDKGVTSMEKILGKHLTLDEVKPTVVQHLSSVFEIDFEEVSLSSLIDYAS
ncbi:lipoyl(octanoyl) transferase LipB [Sulfobacillus thermosulfidooxidans]|uniref:lipoyl(octanoyl) transferase LipB n=1 Tax=Sulfobacillus thermosulfidooxidans TaxID=28034 RepID=UPI0006B52790|nr:lipoyl(octanoyl) transferase LipB [Sulfobacillus thermosulfidooxidans]